MALDTTRSDSSDQYSVTLSSDTHAYSQKEALSLFLSHLASGNVRVEVSCHEGEAEGQRGDLDDLDDECLDDQVAMAISILKYRTQKLSAHRRLEIINDLQSAMGLHANKH